MRSQAMSGISSVFNRLDPVAIGTQNLQIVSFFFPQWQPDAGWIIPVLWPNLLFWINMVYVQDAQIISATTNTFPAK